VKETIFREYDIRGVVGSELMLDQVYDLVSAIAYYCIQKKPDIKKIVVGMDGRIHSEDIKQSTCAALRDSGLDVLFIGTCPSPVVNFALHTLAVDGGIMITASHNPKEYNGFKMSLGTDPIWGPAIKTIYTLYTQKKRVCTSVHGTVSEYSLIPAYITWLVQHFDHLKGMQFSSLIDCANGAAGTVLPGLVEAMEWEHVQLLYPEVDGTYPHHEADPTVVDNMHDIQKLLQGGQYQIGIGLDGDCDRMAPMTRTGELVLGDKLLAFFAQPILKMHPGATVVFDIKSSAGLIELLHRFGAVACVSATGHTNIKEQMKQQAALLGGELSCHFFFKDRYFGYDDGIYAMLRLFEVIIESGHSLEQFLESFPKSFTTREYRIACPDDQKRDIVERIKNQFELRSDVELITLDGVRVMWQDGWGIIRASNTQPILSLRFEARTQANLDRIKREFVDALADEMDGKQLQILLELPAV
jgi:phosphomannomutase/phosphoglucomutase